MLHNEINEVVDALSPQQIRSRCSLSRAVSITSAVSAEEKRTHNGRMSRHLVTSRTHLHFGFEYKSINSVPVSHWVSCDLLTLIVLIFHEVDPSIGLGNVSTLLGSAFTSTDSRKYMLLSF